jgi:hypothetical protein
VEARRLSAFSARRPRGTGQHPSAGVMLMLNSRAAQAGQNGTAPGFGETARVPTQSRLPPPVCRRRSESARGDAWPTHGAHERFLPRSLVLHDLEVNAAPDTRSPAAQGRNQSSIRRPIGPRARRLSRRPRARTLNLVNQGYTEFLSGRSANPVSAASGRCDVQLPADRAHVSRSDLEVTRHRRRGSPSADRHLVCLPPSATCGRHVRGGVAPGP